IMGELALRFVLGGLMVSLFAVCGELFKPKTFAGMFGAAPSVALATLSIAFATHGREYVAIELTTMIPGRGGLVVPCAACAGAAIVPASLTLVQGHDGRREAADDARGSARGALALFVFAAVALLLVDVAPAAVTLIAATAAWCVAAVGLWAVRHGVS